MRKMKMKRRSKKHEKDQDSENDNESVGNNDTNSKNDEESLESQEQDSEPEAKKKKSDKRKSVSFSKKNSKTDSDAEEEQDKEKEGNDEGEGEEEDEEETNYEVEEVLGEKTVRGVKHYLIRWKGYESDSDTWEPESTLNCAELIKQFKATQNENETGEGQKKTKKSSKSKENDKKKDKNKKSKHSIKSKSKPKEEEVDWDSNDEFEVDRILDVYFRKNGQREFLVSWKGYPNSQDSWEPEENLVCSDLIKKFMAKVEEAKQWEAKDLRVNPTQTARLTLRMYEGGGARRLSRRLSGKQRIQYHDAE